MGAPFSLWVYLATTPLLWLTLTVVIWILADWLAQLSGHNPLVNPVMIAIGVIAAILLATGTSYGTYFDRRAIHPFPARAHHRGHRHSALQELAARAPQGAAAAGGADRRNRDVDPVGHRRGRGARPTARRADFARPQIGHRPSRHEPVRAPGRDHRSDGGAGRHHRRAGRRGRDAADERDGASATTRRAALPPVSPRTASARRAPSSSIRSPAPSPASPWG